MQLSCEGLGGRVTARVAPFCVKCAWDGRGAVGRARNKRAVGGYIEENGKYRGYSKDIDLCEVCAFFFDTSTVYQLGVSKQAAIRIMGEHLGL